MMQTFCRHRLGLIGLIIVATFFFVGTYAPFFASGKPLIAIYQGKVFFPLFHTLFYPGYFTKPIDRFFNLLMFTLPFLVLFAAFRFWKLFGLLLLLQFGLFLYLEIHPVKDPESSPELAIKRHEALGPLPSWEFDLRYMTEKEKLNQILDYEREKTQHMRVGKTESETLPTHYSRKQRHIQKKIQRLEEAIQRAQETGESEIEQSQQAELSYLLEKQKWLQEQSQQLTFVLYPLIRDFHWEEDAGGSQNLNAKVGWLEITRINRKDLTAALLFGIRISLVVGFLSILIALVIAIPIGSLAGYFGAKTDIVISRLLEVWEGMPTFFMLLMVVAIMQSKSIFLVIFVIGLFGWTGMSRYIRAEFLKQRNLPYVEGARAFGFPNWRIMFSEILPNAIPPLLTLLPFAIMGAISSEAGLSFLGLGEEGSSSWGVLMDEGRQAFPGESYLLWPPAILLTILLIAIALIGDALRDTLDPKLRS